MLRHSPLLASVPGLAHGFSTRLGPGWVTQPLGLDLGPNTSPRTWDWVAAQAGLPGAGIVRLSQVHGAVVYQAVEAGVVGEGDACFTRRPGLLLAVRVADCVPVLVVDLDTQGRVVGVAAVHAGWRGLAAGVIPATLAAMGPPVARRLAAVGPCIGVDNYEVGAQVVQGVGERIPHAVFVQPGRRDGHWQADLRAAAAWQLQDGGVDQVDVAPWCTLDDPQLHSFRRDGAAAGRLAAVVGWQA